MNQTLLRAVVVVTFALVFYSVGVIKEQRQSTISRGVLVFLTAGIVLDISSTTLMIIGSRNFPFTVHGVLGYSALTVMLIDTILIWRYWAKNRGNKVTRGLGLYTRIAYGWWVIAYIAGAIIAMVLT
jgi:uncharacterized repeat protein (TIGR03987 family)